MARKFRGRPRRKGRPTRKQRKRSKYYTVSRGGIRL